MIDDAWIADLERRAKPLRVELPPWGEVLAREALRAPPREPVPRPFRWRLAVLATAAAAAVVWAWPRPATPPAAGGIDPIPMMVREHMTVASPIVVRRPETPPPPSPVASEDPLASVQPEPTPRSRTPRRPRRPSQPPAHERTDVAPTVDCILDPSLCHPRKTTAPPSDDLPETLSTVDIKRALDGIRPQIHDCARVHGAIPKQKVTIKITISGESGMVTQANIVKPQLSVGLEQCIVAAAHRASFPRFRKATLGAMFPVTMP